MLEVQREEIIAGGLHQNMRGLSVHITNQEPVNPFASHHLMVALECQDKVILLMYTVKDSGRNVVLGAFVRSLHVMLFKLPAN